ncbi:hypothetical protein JTE90_001450 [Oedothorax gibbosus]|uniref:Antimicrobial peptide n=1 Tax=Oedothorax gibbosus TaxID=931172 RepID=A0AAV6TUU9_9ARAC|nr:hypothetical protein JTE90_001450 [Oedothorax gibbosus]
MKVSILVLCLVVLVISEFGLLGGVLGGGAGLVGGLKHPLGYLGGDGDDLVLFGEEDMIGDLVSPLLDTVEGEKPNLVLFG